MHQLVDYAVGKIPFADEWQLVRNLFQPSGQLRHRKPDHARVLDKHREIERGRLELDEREEKDPWGRVRHNMQVDETGVRTSYTELKVPKCGFEREATMRPTDGYDVCQ
jgi:hypothetical protein